MASANVTVSVLDLPEVRDMQRRMAEVVADLEHTLALRLRQIEANNTNYATRNRLVLAALGAAAALGYQAGLRIDPGEPEWPVAYIELPTGQVSWHLPQHPHAWDGHDTPEKYRRCRAFAEQMSR